MNIKIAEFLHRTYSHRKKEKNQSIFVTKIFEAGGSKLFEMPSLYKQKTDSMERQRMLMKKDVKDREVFTADMKSSFPNPISSDLARYFAEDTSDEQLRDALTEIGVGISKEANVVAYGKALSAQMQLFIDSSQTDVEDIVAKKYLYYLQEPEEEPEGQTGAYPNDRMAVFISANDRNQSMGSHSSLKYTWRIKNTGKLIWKNRKLRIENQDKIRPRTVKQEFEIPETCPGDMAYIDVEIQGRGFEGTYQCKWIMVDKDGSNCFPEDKDLNFTVTAAFNLNS